MSTFEELKDEKISRAWQGYGMKEPNLCKFCGNEIDVHNDDEPMTECVICGKHICFNCSQNEDLMCADDKSSACYCKECENIFKEERYEEEY